MRASLTEGSQSRFGNQRFAKRVGESRSLIYWNVLQSLHENTRLRAWTLCVQARNDKSVDRFAPRNDMLIVIAGMVKGFRLKRKTIRRNW